MDCSLPDPSVHGIFQARVLEWVAFSELTSITSYNYLFPLFVVRTFKIYSRSNFQMRNAVLLAMVTMLYIRFPRTYSSYKWKFTPFNQHLAISPHFSPWQPPFYFLGYFILLKKCYLSDCAGSSLWGSGSSVFTVACRIFSCSMQTLSSGMWDRASWPGRD